MQKANRTAIKVVAAVMGLALIPAIAQAVTTETHKAKNVILMISDGAGFNAWTAASMYEGKVGNQPYEQAGWRQMAMTTFPLNEASTPQGGHDFGPGVINGTHIMYNQNYAWDTTAKSGNYKTVYPNISEGYNFLRNDYTDSAAAGTALSTGVKTYNNAVNWDNDPATTGAQLKSIFEIAKDLGKSTGSVSSVQWSHATPASFGAHNISRNNYAAIANEMLNSGKLDVIMGAGNPDYNDSGVALATPTDGRYVGGPATWNALKAANTAGTTYNGFTPIFTKAEFEALADGTGPLPAKVVGTAQVATTLQQSRANPSGNFDPMNANVPDLVAITKGTLNVLAQNPNGFFTMIEGGAVDWAAHANQTDRLIEEQIDFNKSVQAVIDWVNKGGDNNDWDNTLLIVTTDHGNGLQFGPDSNNAATCFDLLDDNGAGNLPGMLWHTGDHTNELVPVYAYGAGAELFDTMSRGTDTKYKEIYGLDGGLTGYTAGDWGVNGDNSYIDNTDVFNVMNAVIPEPATFGLLAMGASAMLLRRRQK